MSNKIDKLFHDRLSEGNLTPRESDWTNMEQLIESDLGSASAGGSISINILFSGFFVIMFIGGIAIHQFKGTLNDFIQTEISSNDKINLKQNTQKVQDPALFQDRNKNANSIQISSALEEQKSLVSSDQNRSKTKIEAEQIDLSSKGNLADQPTLLLNSNQKESAIGKALNKPKKTTGKATYPSNQGKSNTSNKNSASKSKDLKSETSTGNKNATGQSASLSSGMVSASIGPTKKGKPQLNSLSNYPSVNKGDPQLNQSFGNINEKIKNNSRGDENTFKRSHPSSYAPFKNSLILASNPIKTFGEFKKIERVEPFDKEPSLFQTKQQKPKRDFPLQFSIAAFGEASWISKKITGSSEFSTLIEIRNEQEKGLMKFGGGIEFQTKYKNIGFNTGLTLHTYGENIQYEEKYTEEWEISTELVSDTLWTQEVVYDIDTIISPIDSNLVIIVIDSSFVTVIDSIVFSNQIDSSLIETPLGLSDKNGKTQISYWEIPLYFSYQFNFDKFYINPGLGVTIGFWKMTRGYYMAKDEQSLIPIHTEYAVLRKTILNAQVLLGVGYKLNDRFSIEFSPAFKINLNNVFQDNAIIQKYTRFSLQFRLRYYF